MAYMTAAWTAQWQSKKKPDPLKKILGNEKAKQMTNSQMYEQVKLLNAAFGGESNGSS